MPKGAELESAAIPLRDGGMLLPGFEPGPFRFCSLPSEAKKEATFRAEKGRVVKGNLGCPQPQRNVLSTKL